MILLLWPSREPWKEKFAAAHQRVPQRKPNRSARNRSLAIHQCVHFASMFFPQWLGAVYQSAGGELRKFRSSGRFKEEFPKGSFSHLPGFQLLLADLKPTFALIVNCERGLKNQSIIVTNTDSFVDHAEDNR